MWTTWASPRLQKISNGEKRKVTFHVLRHAAASRMAKAGVSLSDVGKILGHLNVQATLHHAHLYSDFTGYGVAKSWRTPLAR